MNSFCLHAERSVHRTMASPIVAVQGVRILQTWQHMGVAYLLVVSVNIVLSMQAVMTPG